MKEFPAIPLETYRVHSADFVWYQNSILKEFRKRSIKFYFRLERLSKRYNITMDELWSIYLHYWVGMSSRDFWRLFTTNRDGFRDRAIKNVRRESYDD